MSKNPTAVSIVIVNLNNWEYLAPCLDSLYDADVNHAFDVVIVDNGSTDGSQDRVKAHYPGVQLIQNGENVGLARACNQGIAASEGRHVLLLNDDTLVNGPSLDAMIDYLDANPDTAAVGGRLMNDDGTVQACYNNFSTLVEEFLIATRLGESLWAGYPSRTTETDIREIDWMCSACLMLRRKALDEVGRLDESFFIYGDEADLQYRLKQAGWSVVYLPHVHTVHFGGKSLNRWRRRRMVYRGKMLFYQKNYGPFRTAVLRLMFASLSLTKMVWWVGGWPVPAFRSRVQRELTSNLEVLRLCYRLQ